MQVLKPAKLKFPPTHADLLFLVKNLRTFQLTVYR